MLSVLLFNMRYVDVCDTRQDILLIYFMIILLSLSKCVGNSNHSVWYLVYPYACSCCNTKWLNYSQQAVYFSGSLTQLPVTRKATTGCQRHEQLS